MAEQTWLEQRQIEAFRRRMVHHMAALMAPTDRLYDQHEVAEEALALFEAVEAALEKRRIQ